MPLQGTKSNARKWVPQCMPSFSGRVACCNVIHRASSNSIAKFTLKLGAYAYSWRPPRHFRDIILTLYSVTVHGFKHTDPSGGQNSKISFPVSVSYITSCCIIELRKFPIGSPVSQFSKCFCQVQRLDMLYAQVYEDVIILHRLGMLAALSHHSI